MKRKISFVVLLIFAAIMLTPSAQGPNAQECRIVRILGGVPQYMSGIGIEPETIMISKGTCVVWNNWARVDEVVVEFAEGKKCDDMTEAPTGFKMDTSGCYVTTWILFGGTSSLVFKENGVFDYMVKTKGGIEAKGKIIVQ